VVSVLATGPIGLTAVGSGPAEGGGFLWVIKTVAHTSFRGEVKPVVPCHRFMACKGTLQSMNEMLCQQNFPARFLTRDFCFATRWLWWLNLADSKLCAEAAG
jgi:hypothetical protein